MAAPNWKHQTLWTGDNLPILRGLNSESVDLVYLDPPFNSNKDYAAPIGSEAAGAAFKDTWTFDDVDRLWLLLLRDDDPTLYQVIEAARLVHGKGMAAYLSMMAQRLRELRRILEADWHALLALRSDGTRLPADALGCRIQRGELPQRDRLVVSALASQATKLPAYARCDLAVLEEQRGILESALRASGRIHT